MQIQTIFDLRDAVSLIRHRLIDAARLHWLCLIYESAYEQKAEQAAIAYDYASAASQIDSFLFRTIQLKPSPVSWPSEFKERLSRQINLDDIQYIISLVRSSIITTCDVASAYAENDFIDNWLDIINGIKSIVRRHMRSENQFNGIDLSEDRNYLKIVTKTIEGPKKTTLPSCFAKKYSLLDYASPDYCDDIANSVAYFWTLSVREAMASDSCALSAVEFDGMPAEFYYDLAKQIWDEARHAIMFFDLSVSLMPEALDLSAPDRPVARAIFGHISRGEALPVPIEEGLYGVMHMATLPERFILMQIQTEGPAVGRIRQRMKSPLAKKYSNIMKAFQVDQRDEIFHTKIGRRWLAHLYPDAAEMKVAIENASFMRPIYVAAALSKVDEERGLERVFQVASSSPAKSIRPFFQ